MNHFGPSELVENVIKNNFCIGCGACIDLCPYFRSYKGKTAMLFPCTRTEGRCFAYCPKVEVDLEHLSKRVFGQSYPSDPLGHYSAIRMSRAGTSVGNGSFQAGGTVSALMWFALEQGYIDGAVLTDHESLLPVPRIVTEPADVLKCSSSKYTASPTLSALNRATREGFKKLGIVATPCQGTAIAQMRANPMEEDGFVDPTGIVVGLFCTWAVDFRAFEAFISERVEVDRIKKIDIPPPPAEIMEIYLDDGKIEFPLSEIRQLVPETCSFCIDMTSEFADISVGVMEGRPDLNTLIIRTERGGKLVHEAQKAGYLILDDMPEENLEHLAWAAGNKKKRALAKANEQGRINTSGKDGRSYLRIKPETLKTICI